MGSQSVTKNFNQMVISVRNNQNPQLQTEESGLLHNHHVNFLVKFLDKKFEEVKTN